MATRIEIEGAGESLDKSMGDAALLPLGTKAEDELDPDRPTRGDRNLVRFLPGAWGRRIDVVAGSGLWDL